MSADHLSVYYSPLVVTHCAPCSSLTELHASFVRCHSTHQSQLPRCARHCRVYNTMIISTKLTREGKFDICCGIERWEPERLEPPPPLCAFRDTLSRLSSILCKDCLLLWAITFRSKTSNTSIFQMDAVVGTNGSVRARDEPRFSTSALHIINQDGASPLSKEGQVESSSPSVVVAELTADHISVNISPEVITDSAPGLVEAELHSTFVVLRSAHQANVSVITQTCMEE